MNTRALTLLNIQGDVTIIWDPENDDKMEEIIRKKMAAGITFFIIEPRFGGLAPPAKRELTDAAEAAKHRALSIRDEDLQAFVDSGAAALVPTPAAPVKKTRVSRDAKEVARSQSVGVRAARGG